MSQTVIRVENLYKEYKLGVISHGTLTHDLQSWWARMRGKEDPNSLISAHHSADAEKDSFLALKDVSFDIKQGDRVGIIGKNGAGKSTLLKILSNITSPTSGQVKIKGRIAALLEVGTGFHPELTGRENIYLNGAILGMSKKEIDRKLDEIVDFAGIEKHIDTPVKRYSSGMNVRLGFAVAAHLEPEILIVDEVLAVGDAEFQKKALGKMEDVSKGEGRTILFVSHNMAAIKSLCNIAIKLNDGVIIEQGDVNLVVANYLKTNYKSIIEQQWEDMDLAPGNSNCKLIYASVENYTNPDDGYFTVATTLQLTFRIMSLVPNSKLWFNFVLYNQEELCVFNTWSEINRYPTGIIEGKCILPSFLLNDNTYYLKLYIHYEGLEGIYAGDVLFFEIHDERDADWYGKIVGVVRPALKWTATMIEEL